MLLRRFLMGLFVAALLLSITEGILRIVLPVARTATLPDSMVNEHIMQKHAYRYDEDLFWYWDTVPDRGSQINEYGFRKLTPMSESKPSGTVRVITFGDSQTYGAGVNADQTYSAVAEAELGPGWEVLNAGLSGYRSLNIYRLLQKRILRFNPDIIVIDCMPFDSARDDGPTPLATEGGVVNIMRSLLWNSRIYYALRYSVEKTRFNRPQWLDEAEARKPNEGLGFGNHDLIAKWADEQGIQTVFMEYAVRTGERITCKTISGTLPAGYRSVPTCEYLKSSGKSSPELFHDSNHLTVLGNQYVGQLLATTLRTMAPERSIGQ